MSKITFPDSFIFQKDELIIQYFRFLLDKHCIIAVKSCFGHWIPTFGIEKYDHDTEITLLCLSMKSQAIWVNYTNKTT